MSPALVKSWLGHSSLAVTTKYVDWIQPFSDDAMALLNGRGGAYVVRDWRAYLALCL